MSSTEPNSQENIHKFVFNNGNIKSFLNMRELLSDRKITDIDVRDKTPDDNNKIHDHTALMVQAGWGTLKVMKMLLDKDPHFKLTNLDITPADPNLTDKNGYTALHLAIKGGKDSYNKVKLLLENGADKTIRADKNYGTPLDYAKTQDKKIIKLLTEDLLTEKSSKSLSNGGTNRNKSKKTHNKTFGRTRKQNVIKKV
jgi:ankyrin repeat protein